MLAKKKVKLGLNIDHVATLRQARGGSEPDLVHAALDGIRGGAEGITVHLREDRRHIQDRDAFELKKRISIPLNLEMSVHEEIVRIAAKLAPAKACFVPERRQELTTEGGLDITSGKRKMTSAITRLQEKGVEVSLFIDPIPKQIQAACDSGADFVEFHTGSYANATGWSRKRELKRLLRACKIAHSLGLGINAGHGLNYENVKPIAQLPYMVELNIGHSIVSRAVFVGLRKAVEEMRHLIRSV
ncbi:MAG: pyridoxine 5'-phosphate synthase [Candidatus Omnitrophica bacterium]|nr:pyridoxine 5'-phosphate synthase [Candidatus Omnitrophota bacterium]